MQEFFHLVIGAVLFTVSTAFSYCDVYFPQKDGLNIEYIRKGILHPVQTVLLPSYVKTWSCDDLYGDYENKKTFCAYGKAAADSEIKDLGSTHKGLISLITVCDLFYKNYYRYYEDELYTMEEYSNQIDPEEYRKEMGDPLTDVTYFQQSLTQEKIAFWTGFYSQLNNAIKD